MPNNTLRDHDIIESPIYDDDDYDDDDDINSIETGLFENPVLMQCLMSGVEYDSIYMVPKVHIRLKLLNSDTDSIQHSRSNDHDTDETRGKSRYWREKCPLPTHIPIQNLKKKCKVPIESK